VNEHADVVTLLAAAASTSQGNAAVEGVIEQGLGDASKDDKEKDKAVEPTGEAEEEEPPAMVPLTLVEVEKADVDWNKEFVKVGLHRS
jgi:hypothetical protein